MRLAPRWALHAIAAIVALSFAYDLWRMPIQVSDSVVEILAAQQSPSASSLFVRSLGNAGYMRPLRLAQIKVLFDVSDGHYRLVYRGFHAVLLVSAILLFVSALGVRTWPECAAGAFALTVFTGLHTFRGTVREAFPINHFLEIVVLCLIAVNLARSRGRLIIDVAAAAVFAVAALTLESGLLVWVVVVAAWTCGLRGISRRGVVAVTALLGAYLWLRFVYFSTGTPDLAERSSGYLLESLEPSELIQRFGENPMWFYVYNVIASTMSVLFSEPRGGVFELVRSWRAGDVPPRIYLAVASSVLTTALIGWVAAARLFGRGPNARQGSGPWLGIFPVVLIANAVLSFAYTKDEIVSVAGAFYALAAFAAATHALDWINQRSRLLPQAALCVMLTAMAFLWAFRSAGVHHMLRVEAFKQRNDWAGSVEARYLGPGSSPDSPGAVLIRQLRHEVLEMRVPNPHLLPAWNDRWWGD
jgi:hypothetical protein